MIFLWSVTTVTIAASLLAKLLADHYLIQRIPILGNFFGLQLIHNPGIAFGIYFAPVTQTILIGMALVVVAWMAVRTVGKPMTRYEIRLEPAAHGYGYALAFGLILGGGIANIIDRIPDGLVTDFVQVGSFPVFNIADSCITIGVIVLLVRMMQTTHDR